MLFSECSKWNWKNYYRHVLWPVFLNGLNWILTCIGNHIHYKALDEVMYPFSNFNNTTVEYCEWIGGFIPHCIGHVTTYPFCDLSLSMLVKIAPYVYSKIYYDWFRHLDTDVNSTVLLHVVNIPVYNPLTENRESLCCQLCRPHYEWHRKLSYRQPVMPPVVTKLASWEPSIISAWLR